MEHRFMRLKCVANTFPDVTIIIFTNDNQLPFTHLFIELGVRGVWLYKIGIPRNGSDENSNDNSDDDSNGEAESPFGSGSEEIAEEDETDEAEEDSETADGDDIMT
ncbi:hypothetical protein N431DRAFT_427048 [Stipitochalara longipes BDJ]|nr:hypothetical protein N431DRAFT_427048 [Stipitochalara longipes BDJ]